MLPFGHVRKDTHKPEKLERITADTLGPHHGIHKHRKLVVSLKAGDLIELRPQGCQSRQIISVFDIYDYAIRSRAMAARMEKLRLRKERKAIRLAQQRQQRAEKKLTRP